MEGDGVWLWCVVCVGVVCGCGCGVGVGVWVWVWVWCVGVVCGCGVGVGVVCVGVVWVWVWCVDMKVIFDRQVKPFFYRLVIVEPESSFVDFHKTVYLVRRNNLKVEGITFLLHFFR